MCVSQSTILSRDVMAAARDTLCDKLPGPHVGNALEGQGLKVLAY
jgi:hypothetical protein